MNPRSDLGTVDPHAQTLASDGERAGAVATPHDPLVGTTIGHFRVDSLLGQGGMGAVYRAWDTSLERPVALTYLVMDLVEGESLAGLLDREKQVSEERALDIIDAVAAALDAANASGLIHRDIKPSNILVEKSGRVLLADFGLAKGVRVLDALGVEPASDPSPGTSGAQVTHAGTIVGTPTYLAPEQASGEPVDHRADIYALGVTLYELIAGQPPFTSASRMALLEQHRAQEVFSLSMLLPEIRPAVDELVLRMLRKRPEERFASHAQIRAVDSHGAKLALGRAVLRSMIKLGGPLLVVIIGDLTPEGRERHVAGGLAILAWVGSLFLALGSRHAALHDRLTRSRVLSALGPSARS